MNDRGRLVPRILFLATIAATAGLLAAHPMGNFSINHYALIMPGARSVEVLYVLDLAELPTFQLLQEWNLSKDSPQADLKAKARAKAGEWIGNLTFTENGVPVKPQIERADYTMQDGAGGLPVMRINAHLKLAGAPGTLEYADRNFAERAGWKEVVIEARAGASVSSSAPAGADRSRALTAYPQDPTVAPPQDVTARFDYKVAAPVASPMLTRVPPPVELSKPPGIPKLVTGATPPEARSLGTVKRGDFLSRTLQRGKGTLTWGLALICLAAAFGVGALHAVEPGHGKTMVAAYLVGSRGTFRQAIFLGGMVTFAHTVSVFALGLVTLFLSQYLLPDTLVRVMGIVSGVSIIWIGGLLLYRRGRKLLTAGHSHHHHNHHHHDHSHHHHPHDHDSHADHSHSHTHTHVPEGEVTIGSLVALGVSGGLAPCPAALVLLLSCISIGRPALGILLLIAFSAGLALVLMLIGVMVLVVKNSVPASSKPSHAQAWARYAPVFSAGLIFMIGIYMTGVAVGALPTVRLIG